MEVDVKKWSAANLAVVTKFMVVEDDESDEFYSECAAELERRKEAARANPFEPKPEDNREEV